MPNRNTHSLDTPIIIGGVGGSGTRVVAEIIQSLGVFIGNDLNKSLDNLAFTFFFKQKGILEAPPCKLHSYINTFVRSQTNARLTHTDILAIIRTVLSGASPHSLPWKVKRAKFMLRQRSANPLTKQHQHRWGWKEPNSHFFIEALNKALPNMRYIHVIRHGFDMAFSKNQNQARFWGPYLLNKPYEPTPSYLFDFWCTVNQRVINGSIPFKERFYLLNYDELCKNPVPETIKLANFLSAEISDDELISLSKKIKFPQSIGRHKKHPSLTPTKKQLKILEQCGYYYE